MQLGIQLHRAIDTYTDSHPLVKQVQSFLISRFGHYSRVITDVFFDYFLVKNWRNYSDTPLVLFSLDPPTPRSSPKPFVVFHWMKAQNWLYAYRHPAGIQAALDGLSRRARFDSKMNESTQVLWEKEDEIEAIFLAFFQDLETFASTTLAELTQSHDPS
ncbi:MAG: acyl carrier protein phosphodiesterase [Bacteroidetes bacterium]|nr:acyl carrier protein phosphodiesterase [Bacteroidota bacterium]